MTFIESLLQEMEIESVGTKKMLALFPSDKADWKPHPKSMTIKDLATHLADIPTWVSLAVKTDELDFGVSPYNPKDCRSADDLVQYFETNLSQARQDLMSSDDSILNETWTLRNGDAIFMQLTRLQTIRHSYGQMVHHRAQLGVYLRLLNIPIPGVYGPSADDMGL